LLSPRIQDKTLGFLLGFAVGVGGETDAIGSAGGAFLFLMALSILGVAVLAGDCAKAWAEAG